MLLLIQFQISFTLGVGVNSTIIYKLLLLVGWIIIYSTSACDQNENK